MYTLHWLQESASKLTDWSSQVLFLFSARPEIYYNLHQIRELHEDLLARIRKVTPMSSLAAVEYDRLVPQGVHERFNPTALSPRALQSRSMRTRCFKRSVLSRFKTLAAEANEALEVAVEIGKLVRCSNLFDWQC